MKELITVIFYGLIAHVDLSPVAMNTAVLPAVPAHQASLCVAATDIDPSSLPSTLPGFMKRPSMGNVDCPNQFEVDLSSAKLDFDGIDETTTLYTKNFERFVAPLSSVSTCRTLKPNVRTRTHGGGAAPVDPLISAYVDYPGGTLDVESYFAMRGRFPAVAGVPASPWSGPQCFACKVSLTMATRGPKVGITVTKHRSATGGVQEVPFRFEVRAQSRLTVVNAPHTATSGHFKHHYDIFSGSCAMQLLEPLAEQCDLPTCAESRPAVTNGTNPDADVECSQSRYP